MLEKANELKTVISEFKNNNTNEYLFWGDNRNYKLYKTIFEEEEIKDYKESIINTIELLLNEREITQYDLDCSFDDTIECYSAIDVKNYQVINDKIDAEEVTNISKKTDLDKVNFIIFKICINDNLKEKELTIIKRFNKPSTVLRQGMRFSLVGDKMKRIDDDVIFLDGQIDAFEYGDIFYIIDRQKFNSIFKFRDMYCKIIDEKEAFIKEKELIDNPEEFINICKNNGHYVKKLTKAIVKNGFENLEKNKHRVKDVIKQHKLDIKIDSNNRIIFEENKIEEIINLLLDHYVKSELSDKRAVARALDYEAED